MTSEKEMVSSVHYLLSYPMVASVMSVDLAVVVAFSATDVVAQAAVADVEAAVTVADVILAAVVEVVVVVLEQVAVIDFVVALSVLADAGSFE